VRRFRFSSSAFFEIPALIINHAAAEASAISNSACGSIDNLFLRGPASVRVRSKVQLPTPSIGYVGIELCRREIGMSEHFLNGTEIGAALEQMSRKRVAQQVGVHAARIEACLLGELAQDEERAGTREWPAAGIEKQLRAVTGVEERTSARQVAAQRLGGVPADRHRPLLAALADHSNEAIIEVDAGLLEPHRLRHPQACAVEQLGECLVAERSRLRAGGRVDQALGFAR
jgi:hypothetical protein